MRRAKKKAKISKEATTKSNAAYVYITQHLLQLYWEDNMSRGKDTFPSLTGIPVFSTINTHEWDDGALSSSLSEKFQNISLKAWHGIMDPLSYFLVEC